MHHQQRRSYSGHFFKRIKALRDQRADRQPAPAHGSCHIGNRRKCALHNRAFFVRHFAGQLDSDSTAQRVAKNIARLGGVGLRYPLPGGVRVFIGHFLRRYFAGCFAKTSVVYRHYRKAQLLHALYAVGAARYVPAGTVQVQHDGCVGAG